MVMVLFKIFLTFAFLTAIVVVSIKVVGDLMDEEIISSEHEETITKYIISLLIIFGGLTALSFILWVFSVVWMI